MDLSRMPNKQDLEQMDAIFLALMCKKLAQDPSLEPKRAAQARAMMEEWMRLQDREMPPSPTRQDYKELDADIAELKGRMVEFLVPFLEFAFVSKTESRH